MDEDRRDAGFNMAVATLQRIDKALQNINESYRIGSIQLLYKDIYNLYKEAYPFLDNNSRALCFQYWAEITKNRFFLNHNQKLSYPSVLPNLLNNFDFFFSQNAIT